MTVSAPITDDRLLTADEAILIKWLLERGNPDASKFVSQLADVRVASRCPCGCASINFAIGGVLPPVGAGMHILADCQWQGADGARFGVFVFSCGGLLAGLEIWSVDGLAAASALPAIEQLQPLVFSQSAVPGTFPKSEGDSPENLG